MLPILRYDPRASGLARWFGPLESAVMGLLWDADRPLTVKRAHARLCRSEYGKVAYTTVATTLGRLTQKGVLTRTHDPHQTNAYIFTPVAPRDLFEAAQTAAIRESLT